MNINQLSLDLSNWLFLGVVAGIPVYAAFKKVKVYDVFVSGAKEGFDITIKIVPYLVAMLVAIGMFRASGGFATIAHWLSPVLSKIGMPAEVLPLALIRPFSGSAANGMLAELTNTFGGNSYIAHLASTMMGSTETTFYVIAVYFGAASIRRTRHAVPAGLIADFVGVMAALVVCHFLL